MNVDYVVVPASPWHLAIITKEAPFAYTRILDAEHRSSNTIKITPHEYARNIMICARKTEAAQHDSHSMKKLQCIIGSTGCYSNNNNRHVWVCALSTVDVESAHKEWNVDIIGRACGKYIWFYIWCVRSFRTVSGYLNINTRIIYERYI